MTDREIPVQRDIRAQRHAAAEAFQRRFSAHGTLVVRLISSPGAGKTTLLQKTIPRLGGEWRVAVLVGDIETDRDAERLSPYAPAVQLTTGGACHLELPLVEHGLAKLDAASLDFLFIEDVGNLVCPASHELGEHVRVILLSTPEGDDKPGKYPKAFRTSQVGIISKIDLLPHVPFSVERAREDALAIQPNLTLFPMSAATGEGVEPWCEFLRRRRREVTGEGRRVATPQPA